jgi:hypothetical protein
MDEAVTRREHEASNVSVWREIRRIREIVEGPPHPGLEKRVDDFLVEFRTIEKERDKQHKGNMTRLNLIIAGLGVIVAGLAFLFAHLSH